MERSGEDALRAAQELEEKMEQQQEVCNASMTALWEECKPCLKRSCVKFYSRTCSSGAGLVGRQLEEVLNRTSPFSIWINGENVNVLEKEDRRQDQEFQTLEKHYSEVSDTIDSMFQDSMRVFDHMGMGSFDPNPFRMPSLWRGPGVATGDQAGQAEKSNPEEKGAVRAARSPFFPEPQFQGFQSLFLPMMDMRNMFNQMGPLAFPNPESSLDGGQPGEDGAVNEDVVVTKPLGDGGQMTCREIRRNSAGCINLKEECEKCKQIQTLDCSGQRPLEGPVKADLERALAQTERLTRQYNSQLRTFEEQMVNTSALLDLLNQQFGWVSALANSTGSKDGIFRIKAVVSQDGQGTDQPGETSVSVQLFDAPPMTFTVNSDLSWKDPKFSQMVAQEALERYKQTTLVARRK